MRRLPALACLTLSACGYFHPPEAARTLRITVAVDPAFRSRPNWQDLVASRIRNASALLETAANIHLELGGTSEWSPGTATPEAKRRALEASKPDDNGLLLGISAPPPDASSTGEPGAALAFDPRVLVFDFPAKSEDQNEMFLAHELAHVFGAWHSPEADSILHLPPGTAMDATAKQVLSLTRGASLRGGAGGLTKETADRLAKLSLDSGADVAASPLFNAYLTAGHEFLNAGRVDDAIEPLTRAVAMAPRDANAHYLLGRADLSQRRFADAAFEFRKVLEIEPRHLPAWNNLGGSLLQLSEPDQARTAFQKALELDPENQAIRANLGVALVRMPGHLQEGIASLQEVMRKHPDAMDEGAAAVLKEALAALPSDAPKAETPPRRTTPPR